MKFSRLLVLAPSALAVLAAAAPAAALGGQHHSRLTMAEARAAARSVAWKVARQDQSVDSARIQRCERRAAARIDCLAIDEGTTSVRRTTCATWVHVRLAQGRPAASRGRIRCQSKRLPLLRNAAALAAFEAAATEAGIEGLRINELERLSRVKILAFAGWAHKLPPPSSEAEELCAIEMEGELDAAGNIVIHSDPPKCTIFQDPS